ncbi:MAG TPA: methyltransferase domain-containing protein [Bacteroidales bacterium]|nr:methyltransferase domain-containing protein [Bacteroidales bacterium]
MMNSVKKSIPFRIRFIIKKIFYLGTSYYCNCCESHIRRFCPGGEDLPPVVENRITGAGYREQDYCPVCKSTYRHRMVWLYLQELKIWGNPLTVLHVAPEEMIARKLRRMKQLKYISGDTDPERYRHFTDAIRLDITQIPFADETFDIIICNHVLEHIPDDRLAMGELHRVLKPEGFAVLQVPLSKILEKTYENPAIQSEEERLRHFGQKDHVRIYGKDYAPRLTSAGFEVTEYNPFAESHHPAIDKLALDPDERVFVARKACRIRI